MIPLYNYTQKHSMLPWVVNLVLRGHIEAFYATLSNQSDATRANWSILLWAIFSFRHIIDFCY